MPDLPVTPADVVHAHLALSPGLHEPDCFGYMPVPLAPGDWRDGKAAVSWRLVECDKLWGWFLSRRGMVIDAQRFDKPVTPGRVAKVSITVECYAGFRG